MNQLKPDDYINYRIERAEQTLGEVQSHLDNGFWNTAINRMYYACFYAIGALLVKDDIEVNSHAGVRQKFGQLYVKPGSICPEWGVSITGISKSEAKNLLPKTVELIDKIKTLIGK